MGFEANGTEQFYKERKMKGVRLNSGFDLQRNKEYCEEKRWGLKPRVDLIVLWNRDNG